MIYEPEHVLPVNTFPLYESHVQTDDPVDLGRQMSPHVEQLLALADGAAQNKQYRDLDLL